MLSRKSLLTSAGTLACAVGIGFFMQQSAEDTRIAPEYEGQTLSNADAAVLDVEEIILTSAEVVAGFAAPEIDVAATISTDDIIPPQPLEDVTLAAASELVMPDEAVVPPLQDPALAAPAEETTPAEVPLDEATGQETCAITANARPIAAAMVKLTLDAPCLPSERVTIHHSGLLFNYMTDASGSFDITVPAMAQDATFIVAFTNGDGAVAQTVVEELVAFERVALQWKGDAGFELHARESGADYGADGHVWAQSPREMTAAVTGAGGYITVLGDASVPDGLRGEVYTFPISATRRLSDVALSVEAEVTQANCGQEIEAQTLQTGSGIVTTTHDLTLSVPDCDAAGNFLVLNNLFNDLKVASN